MRVFGYMCNIMPRVLQGAAVLAHSGQHDLRRARGDCCYYSCL